MSKERKSLGRGLGSIISAGIKKPAAAAPKPSEKAPQSHPASPHGLFSEIAIDRISLSPYQARKEFSDAEIDNLAQSIESEGLMQPILVRKLKDGYELIAGERRLRACKKIGLKKIVASVQEASDISAALKGLIENLQRSDLNPMEEARGVANLIANFKITQDEAGKRLGKPRTSITNALRLLSLPPEIQGYIEKGMLSQGHAKVLLGVEDAARQLILARRIIESGLNVRNTEEAVKRLKNERARQMPGSAQASAAQSAVVRDIQKKISSRLNASVELKHTPKKGRIIIEYLGNDDLQRILELLGVDI